MTESHQQWAWTKAANARKAAARAANEACCRCGGAIDYTLSGNHRLGCTIDHLHPIVLGGDVVVEPSMLAPAHRVCNSRHGAKVRAAIGSSLARPKVSDRDDSIDKGGAAVLWTSSAPDPPEVGLDRSQRKQFATGTDISTPFAKVTRTRPANAAIPLEFPGPHPEAVGSHGDQAVEWIDARMASDPNAEGDGLLWWQWLVAQRSLEYREDGTLCWPLVLLKVMRQQGKSVWLCELAMWRASHASLFGEPQRVLHAARVAALADQQQMAARLWADSQGLGGSRRKADSYVTWPDGSYWHVMAIGAVYGQRVSLALLDEGWALEVTQFWSGLWPAMSQRLNRQAWVFSASNDGDKGLMASIAATEGSLVMTWGAPADADPNDEAVWHAAVPNMTPQHLEGMRMARTAPAFRTEWLNVQPVRGRAEWLPDWTLLPTAEDFTGGVGAVEVSLDRKEAGAAAAIMREDGTIDVFTGSFPTLAAAAEWLKERKVGVVLAGLSIRDQVEPFTGIEAAGLKETRKATPLLADLVRNKMVRHDHEQVTADQFHWAAVMKTEEGELLSAKASGGPIPVAKSVAWAVWGAVSGLAVSQPAPEIW